MSWFRRLIPARQTSACAGCGCIVTERWRRPCPICRSTARIIGFGFDDAIKADVRFD